MQDTMRNAMQANGTFVVNGSVHTASKEKHSNLHAGRMARPV